MSGRNLSAGRDVQPGMRSLPYRIGPAAVVLALVVAGTTSCADGSSPGPGRSPVTSTPGTTGSPEASSTPEASGTPEASSTPGTTGTEFPEDLPSPVGSSGKAGRSVTVRGTVAPGIESGCLLLGQYLLLGGPRDVLQAGRTVSVSGQPVPDQLTTCQQGIPFRVERATGVK